MTEQSEMISREIRIGGGFEIWAKPPSGGPLTPVLPVNLSATGVSFVAGLPAEPTDRWQVRVRLTGPHGVSVSHWDLTVAVNKSADLGEGRWMVGGWFERIDQLAADELAGFAGELAGSIADFLGEFPLFEAFCRNELMDLAQSISPVYLSKGEVLFYEGGEGNELDGLFIVRRGSIKIFKGRSPANCSRTLAVLTPGEVFGEMHLVEPGPHHGSVMALVDAELLLISRLGLDILKTRRPVIALKLVELIARVLTRRLNRTTTKLFSPMRL